ncbi:MAG: S-layer homology domain-containing protein [Firmicutes bacterium]|nr:S-layer homology domain-containing protein [Bacillota bacterium]
MRKKYNGLLSATLILLATILLFPLQAQADGVNQWITPVAGGMSHSIVLKDDGQIWTFGANQQMQLGREQSISEQITPQPLEDLSAIVSVAAGYDFSLALNKGGSVYFLGDGMDEHIYKLPGLKNIVSIAAGQGDGLALDLDGLVWQWSIGETPHIISKLNNIAAIAAGGAHFLALTAAGEIWAWGANWNGQLGNETTIDAAEPGKVKDLINIVSIAAGYSHSLAVSLDGVVYAWGSNTYGQLGDGTTEMRLLPVKVKNVKNAVQVSAGNETSMALTAKNEIYTWGNGEFGQLGNRTFTTICNNPVKINTDFVPKYIASGVYHNFAISDADVLYVWGRNKNHQLGTGNSSDESKPYNLLSSIIKNERYTTKPFWGCSDWAVSELSELYKINLLPPMLWGNYQDSVTRAEFAALLVKTYESIKGKQISLPTYPTYNVDFQDIGGNAFENEIKKAFFLKMVGGATKTSFKPNGKITRQEATKMICTFIAIIEDFSPPTGLPDIAYYNDRAKISEWAVPFVAFAHENDIMQGFSGNFNPLHNLTREQTLLIIFRTIQKYEWI